jgi:hypothetical protein
MESLVIKGKKFPADAKNGSQWFLHVTNVSDVSRWLS